MILSMTGFGDASTERDGSRYAVEIKSLNNRYFKPTIRLPEEVSTLEPEVESLLRQELGRGAIVYTLKMKGAEAATAARINTEALRAYVGQLGQAGLQVTEPERLLFLPGVIEDLSKRTDDTDHLDRHRPVIRDLTREAMAKLMAMRQVEGKMLADDLRLNLDKISTNLAGVKERAPGVVDRYHDRILARVKELLAKAELEIVRQDLYKEVAVFAERSDVNEEIIRLGHHVEQFREAIDHGQHVGRKLDFIAQEMLREANTIGSKANDAQIAGHIVEIKGCIDRIKEQVQNVE